ncbi:MAG: zinc-binding alcohol dehydrogenase family protein [Sphaerochaetaceae bacterium]|nr:zinc-binding alcohol dehydrogenase family protein [Sphaerochaetaceae bacterium]
MKAVYINNPMEVELKEVPLQKRKDNEATLELLYCGICGSDLGSYRGTFAYFDYPRIPGHEISARIVDINKDNNRNLKVGDIVTVLPYFNCTKCYSCRRGLVNACQDNHTLGCQIDGAMSTYVNMPVERLIDGKGLDPRYLAMIEPFCIGYHGALRGGVKKNDKVLVIGAGAIGTFAALSSQYMGANVYVADIAEEKVRNVVEKYNLDGYIVNTSSEDFMKQVMEITNGDGFDVCLEAVGLPSTFQNAIDAAAFGGNVGVIGVGKKNLDFNFTIIQKKELNIFGSRNALREDFEALIDAVNSKKVDIAPLLSKIYPYEEAAKAFKDFSDNQGSLLKVLIQFK